MLDEEVFSKDAEKLPAFRPLGGYTMFHWKQEIIPYLQRIGLLEAPVNGWCRIKPYEVMK